MVLSLSLASSLFALTACGGGGGGVAATVNGTEIMEDTVTERVEFAREQAGLTDDVAWAQALSSNGQTPETYRGTIIDSLASDIVMEQEAESQGYTVNEENIEAQFEATKEISGGGDEEIWLEALHSQGFKDEDAYREALRTSDLNTQLYDNFVIEPTDEELAEYIVSNPNAVEGWAYEAAGAVTEEAAAETDEATAEGALEGEATEEEAAAEETATEDSAEDQEAAIAAAAANLDLSSIPENVISEYTDMWINDNKGTRFEEYRQDLVAAADIVINDMPEGLSYDVDMSLAETATSDTDDAATDSGTDGTDTSDEAATGDETTGDVVDDSAATGDEAAVPSDESTETDPDEGDGVATE